MCVHACSTGTQCCTPGPDTPWLTAPWFTTLGWSSCFLLICRSYLCRRGLGPLSAISSQAAGCLFTFLMTLWWTGVLNFNAAQLLVTLLMPAWMPWKPSASFSRSFTVLPSRSVDFNSTWSCFLLFVFLFSYGGRWSWGLLVPSGCAAVPAVLVRKVRAALAALRCAPGSVAGFSPWASEHRLSWWSFLWLVITSGSVHPPGFLGHFKGFLGSSWPAVFP